MRSKTEINSDYQIYVQKLFDSNLSPSFEKAKAQAEIFGKDAISISAGEGKMLQFFVSLFQCKNFVEIGTLTGYSALWILKAMKAGKFFTLEKDAKHANAAKEILLEWQENTKSKIEVQIIEGDARVSLQGLEKLGPFDGIFIDGNKSAYVDYLDWAEKNLKSGSLILADNVFLGGAVWTGASDRFSAKQISVMIEFNRRLANPEKYESLILPTAEGLFIAKML